MSFDLLAPHYRWMEAILAGNQLHRCRTAFLSECSHARSAMLAGEGHGRFLEELLRANPNVKITCVDASAKMLEVARARLRRKGIAADRVRFIHANILEWQVPPGKFDLIATHFFLDCFPSEILQLLIPRLARGLQPGGQWLVSDFHIPAPGWRRRRAQLILWLMYRFFRALTDLPAFQLEPPDSLLVAQKLDLIQHQNWDGGLLTSKLWGKGC